LGNDRGFSRYEAGFPASSKTTGAGGNEPDTATRQLTLGQWRDDRRKASTNMTLGK